MTQYTFTDESGDQLHVWVEGDGACKFASARDVVVPAKELRNVLAGIAKGMGLSVLILDRPDWPDPEKREYTTHGFAFIREGKQIRFAGGRVHAATARAMAAVLAEMADAADAEPDPEQLAALTSAVRESLWEGGEVAPATADRIARHLLRKGWKSA
uniref:hypothetical protein n=1 Tax=Herbidospora sakaeratensis TaxID=564415 RepID=UPI000B08A429|nr:hypothetical protein [Herbidospora sakaeratensis]